MKKSFFLLIIMAISGIISMNANPPVQIPSRGHIDRKIFYSSEMGDSIYVDIWTPEGYGTVNSEKRYPTIYMHDGQNLFDASTTWNHQAWEVDSIMSQLIDDNYIVPAIVVGIHSDAKHRVADLMPQKAVVGHALSATLSRAGLGEDVPLRGDAYGRFVVETLKPYVDSVYNTMPDAANTSVAGSSMGGLMSIYLFSEYLEIFGNALCVSTHWIGSPEVADEFAGQMAEYLEKNLPEQSAGGITRKLYLDHGTETIDQYYGPYDDQMAQIAIKKGYDNDSKLCRVISPGAAHEENAWMERLYIPLTFLLGRTNGNSNLPLLLNPSSPSK